MNRRTSDANRAADFRISSSLTRASAMASPAMLSALDGPARAPTRAVPGEQAQQHAADQHDEGRRRRWGGRRRDASCTRTVNCSPSASTSRVRTSAPGVRDVSSNVYGATPTNAVVLSSGPPSKRLSPSVLLGRALQVASEEVADDDDASPPFDVGTPLVDGGGSRRGAEHGVTTTIARGIVREATSVLILPTESGIVREAMGRPESRDIASACSATSTERPSIPIMDDSELGTRGDDPVLVEGPRASRRTWATRRPVGAR